MKKDLMMGFELYNPEEPQSEFKLINKLKDPTSKTKDVFFLIKENHLVIYTQSLHTNPRTKVVRLLNSQREFPLKAIDWIIDTIEIKFVKPPGEGGLPADTFHCIETFDNEKLKINRMFAPRGDGLSGYALVNLNRDDGTNSFQKFSMYDEFLFEHGLMDFFKEVSKKYV